MRSRPEIGPISREQAVEIDSRYVDWIENKNFNLIKTISNLTYSVKKGQLVLTVNPHNEKQFILAEVSKVDNNSIRAVDGPVIRVGDFKSTWRVDGLNYCVPA